MTLAEGRCTITDHFKEMPSLIHVLAVFVRLHPVAMPYLGGCLLCHSGAPWQSFQGGLFSLSESCFMSLENRQPFPSEACSPWWAVPHHPSPSISVRTFAWRGLRKKFFSYHPSPAADTERTLVFEVKNMCVCMCVCVHMTVCYRELCGHSLVVKWLGLGLSLLYVGFNPWLRQGIQKSHEK